MVNERNRESMGKIIYTRKLITTVLIFIIGFIPLLVLFTIPDIRETKRIRKIFGLGKPEGCYGEKSSEPRENAQTSYQFVATNL